MDRVALVTGSSGGIGHETALALAREGYRTYATMRDTTKGGAITDAAGGEGLKISVEEMDVDSTDSVSSAVDRILAESGRIDVLVNSAGFAVCGAVEDVPLDEFKAQFETNLFGVIRTVQKVVPAMRSQGCGHIVNISSVAGRIGFPCTPAYISSKFALEGLSESLRYEVDPFGIKVIIIEPGVIKTNFFDAMRVIRPDSGSAYAGMTDGVIAGIRTMWEFGTPPSEVARIVVQSLKERDPPPRYPVGNDAIMFLEAKQARTDLEFEKYLKKELPSGEPR